MICVSIGNIPFERIMALAAESALAEIRLDLADLGEGDTRRLFEQRPNLIATCRPGRRSQEEKDALLSEAIRWGAAYLDIESDAPGPSRRALIGLARQHGCRVIVSYHHYTRTPPRRTLASIVRLCRNCGADIVKIACRANSTRDLARMLSLYDSGQPIIALALGETGRLSRIAAPLLGAPFTYASAGEGLGTAEGQLDRLELEAWMERLGRA